MPATIRPIPRWKAPLGNDAIPDEAKRKPIVRDSNVLSVISARELLSSYLIGAPRRRERGMIPPTTSSLNNHIAYTIKNIAAAVVVGNRPLDRPSYRCWAVLFCFHMPLSPSRGVRPLPATLQPLSLIHISEPTRRTPISY